MHHITQALIGDYSAAYKPTPTPLRTPMQEDVIMQEARNARALRDMTPLSGEELPELYEGTGFGGVTPRMSKMATPNTVLATPNRGEALCCVVLCCVVLCCVALCCAVLCSAVSVSV